MSDGIQIEVIDGFARIDFLDVTKKGPALASLLKAGGPGLIDIDSGGTHRTYVVPESIAVQAGLLAPSKPAPLKRASAPISASAKPVAKAKE